MLYPFVFTPIFKERVWGGRKLAEIFGKQIPESAPIGESWEISDRPGDVSVISNGPLAGRDLRWLLETHGQEIFGKPMLPQTRFPLLIKILDARDKLSLQVHPPAHCAAALGGEPKTEMWHIVDADPGAELFVGLRKGATRSEFERKISSGEVADCFHRIPVTSGDTMFLPSGRVHAIGAGLVIFEIQQNSDTTYRVFDWNRRGLDGKPREVHVRESLASIDFNDFEPALVPKAYTEERGVQVRPLANNELFDVRSCKISSGARVVLPETRGFRILGVITGNLKLDGNFQQLLKPGDFCLIPASCKNVSIEALEAAEYLTVDPGN